MAVDDGNESIYLTVNGDDCYLQWSLSMIIIDLTFQTFHNIHANDHVIPIRIKTIVWVKNSIHFMSKVPLCTTVSFRTVA